MGTIHIAGFPVQIGPKYRQRCAWCETILIDGDLSREMVPEGQSHGPSKYESGTLVEVHKDGPCTQSAAVPHKDGDPLPANACIGPPKLRAV
jgi:hypothetical protein